MKNYPGQTPLMLAVDCIIFGFDGSEVKLLLIRRGFKPEKNRWSLMGGFVQPRETIEDAATRVLHQLTGLHNVYLEQLKAFSEPDRDPVTRTVSVAFFALIDIHLYERQLNTEFHAEWFGLKEIPGLVFDHNDMVKQALALLRHKAALQPVLFELLPPRFTIRQLQNLFEGIFEINLDNRNFIRKLMSTGLLVRLKQKDKSTSKKGAFFYKLDKRKYKANHAAFFNFVSSWNRVDGRSA